MDGLSGNRDITAQGLTEWLDSNFGTWKSLLLYRYYFSFYPSTFFRFCEFHLQNRVSQKSKNAMGFSCSFTNKFLPTKKQCIFFFFSSLKLPVLFKICTFKYGEVWEHNHSSEPGTETARLRLTFKSMFCLFISAFPQNKHLLFSSITISAAERDPNGSQIYAR